MVRSSFLYFNGWQLLILVLRVTIIVRNFFWSNKLSFLRSSRMILVYVLHPFATNFKLRLCSLDNVDFVGAWVALAFVQALATTQVSIYPIKYLHIHHLRTPL